MYGIIYCATNLINGKKYIGQTTKTLEKRKKLHLKDAKRLTFYFHNAIMKYGKENFVWEQIDQIYTKEELGPREMYWIKFYDTINTGYNMTLGGEGTIPTDEVRKRMSESAKKLVRTEEHCRNISLALKGHTYLPHHSEATKEKMRKPKPIGFGEKISIARRRQSNDKEV